MAEFWMATSSATGSSSFGPPRHYVWLGGRFRDFSRNPTVESERGRPCGTLQVLTDPVVHTGPLGKSPGAGKVSPKSGPDAVMAGGGRVSDRSVWEQPLVTRSVPQSPRRQAHDS